MKVEGDILIRGYESQRGKVYLAHAEGSNKRNETASNERPRKQIASCEPAADYPVDFVPEGSGQAELHPVRLSAACIDRKIINAE